MYVHTVKALKIHGHKPHWHSVSETYRSYPGVPPSDIAEEVVNLMETAMNDDDGSMVTWTLKKSR